MAQTVKNLPAVQESQVQCLGQEAPLEEEMSTHSSILAWEIPWTEEPGGLPSAGSQSRTRRSMHTESFHVRRGREQLQGPKPVYTITASG